MEETQKTWCHKPFEGFPCWNYQNCEECPYNNSIDDWDSK